MLQVLFDTTPLGNDNAIRGVGQYTRLLSQALTRLSGLEISTSKATAHGHHFDVVHYPYFDLFFNTLPLKARRPAAKTVVTVHDVIPLLFPDFYKVGVKGRIRFWHQKWKLKHVDAVITDSQASKRDIITYLGVPEAKIHVVYLAANPDLVAAADEEVKRVKREYHLPKKYLLYVGDINYNKNIPQLIKALRWLPTDLHLVCVGKNFQSQPIPEWRWIEAQIAASEVESRVHCLANVAAANQDLAAFYTGAVAYVQPSLAEGFGLPILEAMQCQTPVVCAENSSLIEVGGKQVVFTGTQAQELAAGISQVLAWSASERLNRIKSAYEWSQTFSWKKAARQTYQVYTSLMPNSGTHSGTQSGTTHNRS